MKKWQLFLIVAVLTLAVIGASVFITYDYASRKFGRLLYAPGEDSVKPLSGTTAVEAKTTEIRGYIDNYFIDPYDMEKLADGAAKGMVAATGDRWSSYLSSEDYASYRETLENAYVGIGITIMEVEGLEGFRIEKVTGGSPAEESGIRAGDLLVAAAGENALALGMDETKNRVRGEEGTSVHLTLSRDGQKYEVDVERRTIETEVAVLRMPEEDIACIQIKNFDARCAAETISLIEQARKQGAKGLVFDLRFNPGGLKDELVKLLDYLLPEGTLFRSRDYSGKEETDSSNAKCLQMPMAVLINADSYSAAEFFAAAMQEYDWATVVGEQTCGKGNMQIPFVLSDGSCLNLSIAKYFTPNGVSLTDIGVKPDIPVAISDERYADLYYERLDDAADEQLQAAIEAVRRKLLHGSDD